jgi:hypothetical protein
MVRTLIVTAAGAAILGSSALAAPLSRTGTVDLDRVFVLALSVGADAGAGGVGVSIDAGVGGESGVGVGVGANVGVGGGGEAGVGASIGGGAGSGMGPGGASPGAGAGGQGPGSGGASPGTGISQQDPQTVGSIAPPASHGGSGPGLPALLAPTGSHESVHPGDRGTLLAGLLPLPFARGVPVEIVQACRHAIIEAARPHGVVHVDASSIGMMRNDASGALSAPLEVRVIYASENGRETRQSRISCRLDGAGTVVALR